MKTNMYTPTKKVKRRKMSHKGANILNKRRMFAMNKLNRLASDLRRYAAVRGYTLREYLNLKSSRSTKEFVQLREVLYGD